MYLYICIDMRIKHYIIILSLYKCITKFNFNTLKISAILAVTKKIIQMYHINCYIIRLFSLIVVMHQWIRIFCTFRYN